MEIVQTLAILAILIILVAFVYKWWIDNIPERKHAATVSSLRATGGVHEDEEQKPETTQLESFKFTGLARVSAGQHLMNVPELNPEQAGSWEANRVVIATAEVKYWTKNGQMTSTIIETSDGYVIMGANGKFFLLNDFPLTESDTDDLLREFTEATKGDFVAKNILGFPEWIVKGAYGDDVYSGRPGLRTSSITTISLHPQLGQVGFITSLPTTILDKKPHIYYDLRLVDAPTKTTIGYVVYSDKAWVAWVGRQLTADEVARITAI